MQASQEFSRFCFTQNADLEANKNHVQSAFHLNAQSLGSCSFSTAFELFAKLFKHSLSRRFISFSSDGKSRPGKREVLLAVCRPILARIAPHTGTHFRGTMTLPAFLEVYLQIKVAPPNLRNHIKIIVRVGLSK